tara:strand:+ start:29341 stop:29898 length:558 start_codon:yes stop_codon:yes gene_type:complete
MKIRATKLNDCFVIEPIVHGDERGFFLETYHEERYKKSLKVDLNFVQDNHSSSTKNVLRGIHFQRRKPQGKLVRVVKGEVFDVAVDLRKHSSTFGKWYAVILSEKNKQQLWVPPGFGHGFLVLSDEADFEYKCTSYYDPLDEESIIWNDKTLQIEWPTTNPIVSKKDQKAKTFNEFFSIQNDISL